VTEDVKVTEFLTAEEYAAQQELENKLNDIAEVPKSNKVLKFTRATKVTRQDVVNAFTNAFQMIGGVDRLALWADSNPNEFFKLFAKLMPPAASDLLDGNREFIVRHVLPQPKIQTGPKEEPIDVEFTEVKH
jgi:hypothetical protein